MILHLVLVRLRHIIEATHLAKLDGSSGAFSMSCSLSLSASRIEQTGQAGEREINVFPNNADGSRKILSQLFWLSPHLKYILECLASILTSNVSS